MRESGLLSKVRRKKYSEEVYAARRAAESMKRMRSCWAALLFLQPAAGVPRDACPLYSGRRCAIVQDITYLPCIEGTLCLNSIEDLYNGEIVAWKISRRIPRFC